MSSQHFDTLIEPDNDQPVIVKTTSLIADPNKPQVEDTVFKPGVFLKFTFYFLLAQWLGPLSYFLVFIFIKNGYVVARNLHIFGGWKEIIRSFLWVAKVYCFVLTYTLGLVDSSVDTDGENTFESRSQFWLVIYTDIALSVLHGAYYSSFTDDEIYKFENEVYRPSDNIVNNIVQLIRDEKTKAFDRNTLLTRFPEMDINNFFFVYPQKYEPVIPQELNHRRVGKTEEYLSRILINDGIIVDGEKYAAYLINKGGYQNLNFNILAIRTISRVLVFIRVLLPVLQNVEKLISYSPSYQMNNLILYIFQQIFYCYFIAKFAEIYDVLFIGLLLYYRRLRLLRLLKHLIEVRPGTTQTELLKIEPTVLQNVENWLNLRKIFTGMNQQAFIVIDINTSFTLLYTVIFLGFYILYAFHFLTDLVSPIGDFMSENAILTAAIFFTIIIVVIVLLIHLFLGIMINLLFRKERKEWTLQSEIIRSIRISHNVYQKARAVCNQEFIEDDEYLDTVTSIQSMVGPSFQANFEIYIKRLRDSILLVLDGLDYEETLNPHTLLGIKTTPRLAISLVTGISVVGLSTINAIIKQAVI